MSNKVYNIHYKPDNDVVGEAVELDDGQISVTINGIFSGIYSSFNSWNSNVGGLYELKEKSTSFEMQVYDEFSLDYTLNDVDDFFDSLGQDDDPNVVVNQDAVDNYRFTRSNN
jgi:hypothetical protein